MELLRLQRFMPDQSIEPSDVMHCVLGLRNLEINIYFYLLKGSATVKEVADGLGRTRSTIQRAIQNLVNRGFATRRVKTLRKGGYVYIYEAVSLDSLRKIIRESLDSFYDWIIKYLERMWVETSHEPTH
jgi:predicted transcriptional regulator